MQPRNTFRQQQRSQTMSTGLQPQNKYNQLAQRQSQQKIRNINEETETEERTETEETIDPELTCYIREMMEDWQNINFIKTINFTNEKVWRKQNKQRRVLDKDKNKQLANILVGRYRKPTQLHEHRHSTEITGKWKDNHQTAEQIDWRISMLQ